MGEVFTMRRRGMKLECVTPYEEDLLSELPEGKDLTVTITRQRSQRQHRFFWALITKVAENHETYRRPEQLLLWIKIRLGYVEEVKFHNDEVWWTAKSISFNAMDQGEFLTFFNAALDVICVEVIPNLDKKTLVFEVEQMLGFKLEEIWGKKNGV